MCSSDLEVEATYVHHDVPTLEVTTTAGTITTTSTHPFYVQGRRWTPAANLKRGDRLKTPDNTTSPDPDNRTTTGPGHTDDTASTIGADAVPTGDGETVAVLTIQPTGRTTTVHNLTIRSTHDYHTHHQHRALHSGRRPRLGPVRVAAADAPGAVGPGKARRRP